MIPALSTLTADDDETRPFEDAQVLHYGESSAGEPGGDLAGGPGSVTKQIEDCPAVRVCQRRPDISIRWIS